MADQLLGAASWAVLTLAYLLLVEALAAAIVVLAEFTVYRVRSLRGALNGHARPAAPAREVHEARGDGDRQPYPGGTAKPYRLGGGLMRW
jgi:hypothetical protein